MHRLLACGTCLLRKGAASVPRHHHGRWRIVTPSAASQLEVRTLCRETAIRSSSSRAPPGGKAESGMLIASSETTHSKLAGAIAARIRYSGKADVTALGPQACYNALRAVAVAGEFLRDDIGEKELLCRADRLERPADKVYETTLHVTCAARPAVVEEVPIYIAQETNIGKVASFVARTLQEQQDKQVPALRAMGADAASQAIKAAMIADTFLRKEAGTQLLLSLRQDKQLKKDASAEAEKAKIKKRVQLVLACRSIKTAESKSALGKASDSAPAE
eukprot:TRINITY_DN71106_c1_g1_i4.p1 TRINITY_DN71106_c1_g1~~TRINITY_DN71106_c1_g1_i4.p1  ORF type:complete len:276 (+),score=81.54 TRINITY_DN71106_c1_g1_i4:215-1042(+)